MNMTKMAAINSNEKSPLALSSSAAHSATSSPESHTDSRYQGLEEHTNESSDPSCIIVGESNSNEEHIVSDLGEMAKSASTSQQRCGGASGNSVKIPPHSFNGDEQRYYYLDQWLLDKGLTNHDGNSHPTVSFFADNELKLLQCFVLFPYPTADQVQTLANELDVNMQTVCDWFTRKRLTNGISWSEADVSYARSQVYKIGKPKIAEHHNNLIEEPKGAAFTVEVNKEHAAAALQAQALLPQQRNKQQQQQGSGVPAVRTISLETRSNMPTMPKQQMQASFLNYQINQPNQVQEIVQSSSQWANGFCRPPSYVTSNFYPTILPSNPHTQQQQQQYGVMYMKQPINPRLQQPNQQQQPPAGSSMIYHRYADQPGLQQPTANMNQIMRHPLNGSQQQPTLVAPTKNNQFMVNGGQRPTSSDNNHRQNSSSQDPDGGASLFVYQFPGNPQQSSFIPANGAVAQQQQGVGEKGQFTHHITNNAPTLRSSDALAKKKFVGKKIDSHFLQYWPDGLGCNLLCSCNFTHSIDVDKYCLIVNLALQPFNTYQVAKPELEKCSYRPKENILPPCCVQSLFYIVRMRLLPKESLGVPATWSMESEQFDRRQADWSSFSNEQLLHLNEYFINCPYPSLPGFLPIIKKSRVSRNFIQTYFYTIRRHIKMFVENQYGDGDKYGHIYSSMDLWKSKKGDCDKVHTFCMRVVFGDTDKKKSDYFRKAFEK